MSSPILIPAAQYLRMSTEHQQYSLANQADAIAAYAQTEGFRIIKTYEDAGKSGVALAHRRGLKQLLEDVLKGAEYRAILVYDVSRWGRFQDSDEAAHYEFVCIANRLESRCTTAPRCFRTTEASPASS
jgi:DNA invertase Pin-like site-specific DNA recombinase